MYEIQSGVPLPPARRNSKYPFDLLAIGDSFAVPVPLGADAGSHSAALRQAAYAWANKHGSAEMKVRLNSAKTEARVWRIT